MRSGRPQADAGLPAAVPLLAGLGLALLCVCTLPAVHAQRRLERDHARAARETREAEARVERLRRELDGGAQQRYLRIKAASTLLHRGARRAAAAPPGRGRLTGRYRTGNPTAAAADRLTGAKAPQSR